MILFYAAMLLMHQIIFIYAYSYVNSPLFKANRHPASIVLYIETEQDHIAVLYHIFFSFQSYQTFFTGCSQ